jgi:hypothetical protein
MSMHHDANEPDEMPESIVTVIYSDLESPSSPSPSEESDISGLRIPLEMESSDTIVKSVMTKFASRSRLGVEKYGTTLDRTDVSTVEWVNHLQEELMDAILYRQRNGNWKRKRGNRQRKWGNGEFPKSHNAFPHTIFFIFRIIHSNSI